MAATQLGESKIVGLNQPGARFIGALKELSHSGVTSRGFVINFNDRLRRSL